ncbi:MAG TPA: hypothetical protein ENJ79_04195 [Gammaproteobacteria bacterium]|nr:hypothetical protein [Gammaproteobacteria bacterium]
MNGYRHPLTLTLLLLLSTALAAGAESENLNINPHWSETRDKCLECHVRTPQKGEPLYLRFGGNINKVCNRCHSEISKDKYIHATGMIPPRAMFEKMPANFRAGLDPEDRITCAVCHEISYQCLKEEFWRQKENRLFHRGAPYETRTDLCYNCHDRSKYKKLNPHDQINDEGELIEDICTYCHEITPDRRVAKSIEDVSFNQDKFDQLCLRCHTDDAYAVGCVMGYDDDGNPIYHATAPDARMANKMIASEENAILPLEIVTGNIFCGTCHNPHELGVQVRGRADAGADSHKRLRISKKNARICLGCHDTKDIKKFHLP